ALLAARQAAEYAAKQLLPVRAEILQETLRQYNAMQKSTYDLLFARQNEESAVTTYVTALRDYWIARVALEHAIGGRLPAPPAEATPGSAAHQPST
ncbi:MAG: TolC family protein, partial [Burkholderiales bacterium]|nr:TolC family protein [Burkholderiales bacterium]